MEAILSGGKGVGGRVVVNDLLAKIRLHCSEESVFIALLIYTALLHEIYFRSSWSDNTIHPAGIDLVRCHGTLWVHDAGDVAFDF